MRLAIILIGVLFTSAAFAASFDCTDASTSTEQIICSNLELSAIDEELASVYENALIASHDESILREEQLTWLTQVRNACDDGDCIMVAYQNRIYDLSGTMSNPNSGTNEVEERSYEKAFDSESAQLVDSNIPPQKIDSQNQPLTAEDINKSSELLTTNQIDEKKSAWTWEWIVAAITGAWVWHKFLRRRCPKCKSTNVSLKSAKELDSWIGTKEVSVDLGNGRTKKKVINTTYTKMENTYRCTACREEWVEVTKEEKE